MRNHVLDAEKAMAAYFVVVLHIRFPGIAGEILNAVARFAVPLFFMISGYFCYRRDEKIKEKLPGKIRHTLSLCAVSFGVYIIWQWIQHVIEGKSAVKWFLEIFERENIKEFLYYNNTTPVKWHLWFLPALLYCYIIFYFVEKGKLHKLAGALIPVLLLVHFIMEEGAVFTGHSYQVMEFRNYLYTGFPFFMAGYWIHRKEGEIKKYVKEWMLWTAITGGIVLSVAEYFHLGKMELFLGSVLLAVSLFLLATVGKERQVPAFVAEIGVKYSFFIYLFHLAVSDVFKDVAQAAGVWDTFIYSWLHPLFTACFTTALAMGITFAGGLCMRRKKSG